jgi:SpoIID/LytB domain protein
MLFCLRAKTKMSFNKRCFVLFIIALLFIQFNALADIRVKLSSLNIQDRIHIGVYGSYIVNDKLSFQRGSEILVAKSKDGLMLYHEGLAYSAGKEIVFKRLAEDSNKENGLRLQHRLELYEGTLKLTAQNDNILAVLHIDSESYLKGVVPYEMSDSFPIEALKAQAVAARTYAKANVNAKSSYDVEDNTNDQVFKGKNQEHKNSFLAIESTKGECLYYGDSLAKCYYTASNGGRTETNAAVWSEKAENYLPAKTDKYDLENPNSPVRTAIIPKKWDKNANIKLSQLIIQYALPQIEKAGYLADEEQISIDEITGLEMVTNGKNAFFKIKAYFLAKKPMVLQSKDEEVSLFNLSDESFIVSTPVPTDEPVVYGQASRTDKAFTVLIPYYKHIETALDISINSKDNEIISLEETDAAYKVSARRFGHGVGMSQRGAEQMAKKYNKTYREILYFYYPGTKIKKTVLADTNPSETLPVEFLTTPGPPPTATPRPTLMPLNAKNSEQIVVVSNIGKNSTLNLRSEPSLSSKVKMQLFYGQELAVIEKLPDGWLKVRTDVVEGFVAEEFISLKPD